MLHYKRSIAKTDMDRPSMRQPLEVRFWNFVQFEPNSGCWLWSGPFVGPGYGVIKDGRDRTYLAHRLSWELAHKAKPALFVLHHCDTPSCVNPAHLFLGTQADNMKDRKSKGRYKITPALRRYHVAQ